MEPCNCIELIQEKYPKNYDEIGKIFPCPKCGTKYTLCYDETYDPESGEEENYWWYERAMPEGDE